MLSSLDKIDVRVELLADYVWEADDDKPAFLSAGVDGFNRLFLCKRPMSLSIVDLVIKIENMINENKWKRWTNRKKCENINFDECSKKLVRPSMKISKNVKDSFWWISKNCFLVITLYLRDITFSSQILRAFLSKTNGILYFWKVNN